MEGACLMVREKSDRPSREPSVLLTGCCIIFTRCCFNIAIQEKVPFRDQSAVPVGIEYHEATEHGLVCGDHDEEVFNCKTEVDVQQQAPLCQEAGYENEAGEPVTRSRSHSGYSGWRRRRLHVPSSARIKTSKSKSQKAAMRRAKWIQRTNRRALLARGVTREPHHRLHQQHESRDSWGKVLYPPTIRGLLLATLITRLLVALLFARLGAPMNNEVRFL